jgi:hypothetical protein
MNWKIVIGAAIVIAVMVAAVQYQDRQQAAWVQRMNLNHHDDDVLPKARLHTPAECHKMQSAIVVADGMLAGEFDRKPDGSISRMSDAQKQQVLALKRQAEDVLRECAAQ